MLSQGQRWQFFNAITLLNVENHDYLPVFLYYLRTYHSFLGEKWSSFLLTSLRYAISSYSGCHLRLDSQAYTVIYPIIVGREKFIHFPRAFVRKGSQLIRQDFELSSSILLSVSITIAPTAIWVDSCEVISLLKVNLR